MGVLMAGICLERVMRGRPTLFLGVCSPFEAASCPRPCFSHPIHRYSDSPLQGMLLAPRLPKAPENTRRWLFIAAARHQAAISSMVFRNSVTGNARCRSVSNVSNVSNDWLDTAPCDCGDLGLHILFFLAVYKTSGGTGLSLEWAGDNGI